MNGFVNIISLLLLMAFIANIVTMRIASQGHRRCMVALAVHRAQVESIIASYNDLTQSLLKAMDSVKKREVQPTFMDRAVRGDVTDPDKEVDDAIDAWHEGATCVPLWEFLGMSREEFDQFVTKPSSLRAMVEARKGE